MELDCSRLRVSYSDDEEVCAAERGSDQEEIVADSKRKYLNVWCFFIKQGEKDYKCKYEKAKCTSKNSY